MYLTGSDVVGLSEAFRRTEIVWWTIDFASAGLLRTMNGKTSGMLQNAPFKFAPPNGLGFFENLCWKTATVESVMAAAYRFDRLVPTDAVWARLPQPDPRRPGNRPWSAVACLTR